MVVEEPHPAADEAAAETEPRDGARRVREPPTQRGKTVHGEAANAGHRVLAPDDAEVEAYLETALNAPTPTGPPATDRSSPTRVVVLDFGSQFAQLIARRVRELNVYSELLPHDTPGRDPAARPRAIILSGGPNSVYDDDAPRPDPAIWRGEIPVLGICYGAQLMAHELGGDVLRRRSASTARRPSRSPRTDGLFSGLDRDQPVWMSHGDSITRLPPGFTSTAQTDSSPFAGLVDPARNLYGIQFHPEVVHTPRGRTCSATSSSGSRARRSRGRRRTSSTSRSPRSAAASTSTPRGRAPTASSSARCRAASTRRWRPRSSIGRSGIG